LPYPKAAPVGPVGFQPKDFRRSTAVALKPGSDLRTFQECLEEFRYYLINEVEKPKTTIKAYTYGVRLFIWFLQREHADLQPRAIDSKLYIEFQKYCREERKLSESTRSSIFTGLRAFFGFLTEKLKIPYSPLDRLKFKRKPRPKPKPLRLPQVLALLEVLNVKNPLEQRDGVIIELLFGSGLRISEALGATVSSLEFDELRGWNTIKVLGKGAKERVVPLTPVCTEKLKQWIKINGLKQDDFLFRGSRKDGSALRATSFCRRFVDYARAAKLPAGTTPHKLRHGFATELIDRGADIKVVQELLGHSNLSVTGGYIAVSIERFHLALRRHPRSQDLGELSAREQNYSEIQRDSRERWDERNFEDTGRSQAIRLGPADSREV
jgi:site-specific recombinase XerD